ncbi:non-ribosomal peptide synthetase [Micromonospora echinofusca]|uniref:Amino acid adenylation domain-containing protein n=1 Tax=Micromonospora echinofusca TaxID=47858 RepID=A0ABS3VLH5_MICEH|nr:non-ribosomal peptide synthetase [Micromonospora echinofusca]MBO4205370.1 amino acid adenylation domain-containing protein [Micromonospora echinofusca]
MSTPLSTVAAPGPDSAEPVVLPELVTRQALSTPHATALVAGDERVDYADLDRRANRLAHHLVGLGVGPESLVGVYLRRGVDLVVALLAVWRAGGAYVPLDPTHPADRRRWIIGETGVDVLLTQVDLLDEGLVGPTRVVCLDADRIPAGPDTAPDVPIHPDHAAYVLYTSGSTGRPKGVVITHRGIGNRVAWTVRRPGLAAGDRVLQKTPVSFDAAGWEFFAPLICGATVVLAPDGADRDPAALVAEIIRSGTTVLQGVPSVLHLLVEEADWSRCHSLRLVFSAGEPLHAELCQRLRTAPGVQVWNTYGPTECAIDVTAQPVDPDQRTGPVPIGRPLDNLRLQVLDGNRRPVPVGVVGDLYVGGAGLGRGYLNRPDLTADRFVPDEYGPPGARLYRTGDQVRWRTDRTLEFVGRSDDQVKVNGVRIEPAEVEAVLAAHPDVRRAVVVATGEPGGPRQLAAYVAGRRPLTGAELRAFLTDRLPEPLVPAVFVPVDEFPLTTSGKIDRSALPPLDSSADRPDHQAPRTEAERLVARVWQRLLDVDRVGVHDDIHQLGGSSLVTIRLAGRLAAESGIRLDLRDLLTATTVAQQAALLEQARAAASAPDPTTPAAPTPTPVVVPVPRTGPLPLSAAQRRLWLLDRLHPASPEWVVPLYLRLPGALDPATVRAALTALETRHEALRTRYLVVDGEPQQRIAPPGDIDLVVRPATGTPLAELVDAQLRQGFDLATGPLWRATLVTAPGQDHLLLVALHHIASDAGTAAVLERDLRHLCTALAEGHTPDLPPLPVQYADYATWQHRHLTDALVARELDFWRAELAGVPELALPTDRPRPPVRDPHGAHVAFDLPADLATRLTELGRSCAATPFMTLLAGFATLLGRYTGQWDVPVGAPASGNRPTEVEQVAGVFLNPVVLRCTLDPAGDFRAAVAAVRDRTVAALAHQELPFERLVEDLVTDRDLSRTPLYQVMLNVQEGGITGQSTDDPTLLAALHTAAQVAKTDLTMHVWPRPDGSYTGTLEYATALFDAATVQRLADHFVRLLTAAVTRPDERIGDLDLLSPAEREHLLYGVQGRQVPRSAATVCDLFEAQRDRTPDAVALRHHGSTTSYATLDDRANRIAHHLRRAGTGTGDVVAVLLDRGPDLVAAILGTWKAGAAVLPLDPAYPAARIGHMLATAGVRLAVTRSGYAGRFDVPTLHTDTHRLMIGAGPTGRPDRDTDPEQTAYVLFTSGSTGRPKGVLLSHRAVSNFLACATETEALGDRGDRAGQGDGAPLFTTIAFDLSIPNLFSPLTSGQSVTLLPADLDIARLGRLLVDAGPYDRFIMTPPHLELLTEQLDDAQSGRLSGLIWTAGAALRRDTANRWLDRLGPGGLTNSYGPTETTVIMTAYPVTEPQTTEIVPIGRPLANTVVRILDDGLRLLPVGAVGELYIGGACLATGYAGRPDLTAERFLPDPYGPPGSRLYRSGDLVRMRPDGTMDFVGRADDQVKVRGYRVELGEVRAVVEEHPGVRQAAVVVHDDRLVAFHRGDAPDLAGHCARLLPDFMVPGRFVPVPELPLNTNGKVDRAALLTLLATADAVAGDAGETPAAPRTVVEERIAAIWRDLLAVPEVGVRQNFFALGGHSVLAARLVAALQEEFDLDVPIRLVFQQPTVEALATGVEDLIRAEVDALPDADLTEELRQTKEHHA